MSYPQIKEYFFNNFENILDEAIIMRNTKDEIISLNTSEFHEEIEHQSEDEYIRNICVSCSTSLGLPYDEVYECLENKLEELYYVLRSE